MPESLLHRRLKLGNFLGIDLFVHWSFSLIVAYVVITTLEAGYSVMGFALAQLMGVFCCVTLHEYGHSMAARCFGIGTADITLLPIGGVARLRQMPRIPWQELVVALAGPAVNVVIFAMITLGLWLWTDGLVLTALIESVRDMLGLDVIDERLTESLYTILSEPSVLGFFAVLLVVNSLLVAFNLIPAFPMDGGRVFRSLLAMAMEYRKATMIASRVGLVCAFLMAFFALTANPPNPIPVLIAAFIGYAGLAEARQVDVMESVRGLTAGRVMIRSQSSIPVDLRLDEIRLCWQSSSAPALPVVDQQERVVGMLRLTDVAEASAIDMDPMTTAGQLIESQPAVRTLREDDELEAALLRAGRHRRQIPVVDTNGSLIGIVDLDSMLARAEISGHTPMTLNEFS